MRNSFLSWSDQFYFSLLTLLPYSNQKSFCDHWQLPQFATHSTDPDVKDSLEHQEVKAGSKASMHILIAGFLPKVRQFVKKAGPRGDLIPTCPRACWSKVGWPTKRTLSIFNSNFLPHISDLVAKIVARMTSENLEEQKQKLLPFSKSTPPKCSSKHRNI